MAQPDDLQPHRPANVPECAMACLDALAAAGLGDAVSLVASKMAALVERGAPRDFRDIHAVCAAGLTTRRECWNLWRRRQELAGGDCDADRARLAVETHLARIARYRPLQRIADAAERERAEQVRSWFAGEFLDAIRWTGRRLARRVALP